MAQTLSREDRLRAQASALDTKIEALLTPHQENTHKRRAEGDKRRSDATRLKRIQSIMRGLADNPDVLPQVDNRLVVENLLDYEAWPTKYDGEVAARLTRAGLTAQWYDQARQSLLGLEQPVEPNDPTSDRIRELERDIQFRNIPGYFPTPPPVVSLMLQWAIPITPGMRVLEPGAGKGNIVDAIRALSTYGIHIEVCEVNPTLRELLTLKGYSVVADDFLTMPIPAPEVRYDRILMNAPFEQDACMAHTMRAYEMLKPNGKLVSIVSGGVINSKSNVKRKRFNQWLTDHSAGRVMLDSDAFKNSERSTGVQAWLVAIEHGPVASLATQPAPSLCPDCQQPWNHALDPIQCPSCGLGWEDIEAGAELYDQKQADMQVEDQDDPDRIEAEAEFASQREVLADLANVLVGSGDDAPEPEPERSTHDQLSLLPDVPPECDFFIVDLDRLPPDSDLVLSTIPTALLESIPKLGVISPVLLLRTAYDANALYEIMDGRRRVAASRKLGLDRIPALIYPVGSIDPSLVGLVSNEQRSQNELAMLMQIEKLIAAGHGVEDIRKAIGWTKAQWKKYEPLLNLLEPLKIGLLEGKMGIGTAVAAAKLPRVRQQQLVEALAEKRKLKSQDVREVRQAVTTGAVSQVSKSLFGAIPEMTHIPLPRSTSWSEAVISKLSDAINLAPPTQEWAWLRADLTQVASKIEERDTPEWRDAHYDEKYEEQLPERGLGDGPVPRTKKPVPVLTDIGDAAELEY